MGLIRPLTQDVVCDRDLRVEMDDGAVLLADRWVARDSRDRPQPTVLVRSPYGRRQFVGFFVGRLLAERGLQVLIQSTRGTFGSEGDFSPFDERADGLATIRWLREQAWHSERIGMIGPSYLGIVQWAVAPDAGEDLRALAIQVSASQFHGQTYAGGSMTMQTSASWLVLVAAQERRFAPLLMATGLRRLPAMLARSPLSDLDHWVTGAEVAWFREGLGNPRREDAYWVARDYAAGVETVDAPVQLIGGWWDIFLPWMLEDFSALKAAGRAPQLIIGPWTHTAPGVTAAGLRDGLAWLRAGLLDDHRLVQRASIRVYVSGERAGERWRELEAWPPPGTSERRLWLGEGGTLENEPPATASEAGDRYRYDPADPTPVRRRPDAAGKPPRHRQPRARAARGRADLHDGAAAGGVRSDRPGPRRAPRPRQLTAFRPVRARVRRRLRRRVMERLRRADAGRPRAGPAVRRRNVAGHV